VDDSAGFLIVTPGMYHVPNYQMKGRVSWD